MHAFLRPFSSARLDSYFWRIKISKRGGKDFIFAAAAVASIFQNSTHTFFRTQALPARAPTALPLQDVDKCRQRAAAIATTVRSAYVQHKLPRIRQIPGASARVESFECSIAHTTQSLVKSWLIRKNLLGEKAFKCPKLR